MWAIIIIIPHHHTGTCIPTRMPFPLSSVNTSLLTSKVFLSSTNHPFLPISRLGHVAQIQLIFPPLCSHVLFPLSDNQHFLCGYTILFIFFLVWTSYTGHNHNNFKKSTQAKYPIMCRIEIMSETVIHECHGKVRTFQNVMCKTIKIASGLIFLKQNFGIVLTQHSVARCKFEHHCDTCIHVRLNNESRSCSCLDAVS